MVGHDGVEDGCRGRTVAARPGKRAWSQRCQLLRRVAHALKPSLTPRWRDEEHADVHTAGSSSLPGGRGADEGLTKAGHRKERTMRPLQAVVLAVRFPLLALAAFALGACE